MRPLGEAINFWSCTGSTILSARVTPVKEPEWMFGADSSVALRLEKRVGYSSRDVDRYIRIRRLKKGRAYLRFALDTVALNGCSAVFYDSNSFRGTPDWRIIDCSVPTRISLWSGTGTVMVPGDNLFCIITWLPRCRTLLNPCFVMIAQTSLPERARSLPKSDLDLCHKHFAMKTFFYLLRGRRFKEEFKSLAQIVSRLLDRIALAGNIDLRTQRNISISFSFDYRC